MDRPKLIGDIVTHWHKFGERRKTVAFAVNVAHSVHLRDEFVRSGVRAEHIDGSTPKPERDATLARLASGDIEVVCNCMVLTEGWDMPEVGCCHPGASDPQDGALSADDRPRAAPRRRQARRHRPRSFAARCFGMGSSRITSNGRSIQIAVRPRRRTNSGKCTTARGCIECTQCGAIRVAGEPCPHCGFLPQRPPRNVAFLDGDLGLVDGDKRRAHADLADPALRAHWHAMLAWIAEERGYKPGWVGHQVQRKIRHLAAVWRAATANHNRHQRSAVGCARA